MSDTSGVQAATTRKQRSLADIVREKTNDGETIVQFYLDVASGKLGGFRDNHRMAAANKIGKIAPDLVARYLVRYRNSDCRDSLRGTTLLPVRRPLLKQAPPEREPAPRGPSVFGRRLARIVREETGDGRAIVVFLEGVMHGLLTGFKPHHRLEAADKLADYLNARPNPLDPGPVPGTKEGPTQSVRPESQSGRPNSKIVRPEPVLSTGEGPVEEPAPYSIRGQCSAETTEPVPSPLETLPNRPSLKTPPSAPSAPSAVDPPMTLAEIKRFDYKASHLARYMFARDDITGGIYAFDELGPMVVDEEGNDFRVSPDTFIGCERVLDAYRNRDRWPDDVPRPYEDFSSKPPPPGHNPIKIWL